MDWNEKRALELLEGLASEYVVDAAKAAVATGTHTWHEGAFGEFGLCPIGDDRTAVLIVYPAASVGGFADFEVDETWCSC